MVFNWFRRQFSESVAPQEVRPATPQEEDVPTPASDQPEAEPASSAALEGKQSEDVTADYLSWAKAAYKNIQQQQSQQEQAVADETTSAQEQPAQTTESEATDTAIALGVGEAIALEPSAPTADGGLSSHPTAQIESGTPVTPETTDAAESKEAPLPFWAKAEAERLARMERLKATAVEIPEPEVVPPIPQATATTATKEAAPEMPGLAFDEGFLWSAEILAAQGRRPEDVSVEEITWLKKLRQGLDKTRRNIVNQLKAIVGQGPLNQAAVMEIEALLLQADVGVEATDHIISALQNRLKQEALPLDAAIAYLKQILRDMLDRPLQTHNPVFAPEKDALNIWLITGVNGAGKTTTIGKIAHIAQKSGYKCLIAAADTFRAAAVEQVKIWGSRSSVEVIANLGKNTDPAAVVFDAIAAAQSRSTELLLVDTAGRLQNKKNLMEELSKVRRIIDKKADNAKVESLLVLDATLGQNGLRQAEVFAQAAQLSGVVLTKLDGTAKGGVALAVVQQLGLPIRFIGAGEGIEDLRPFSSYEFVEALLSS